MNKTKENLPPPYPGTETFSTSTPLYNGRNDTGDSSTDGREGRLRGATGKFRASPFPKAATMGSTASCRRWSA